VLSLKGQTCDKDHRIFIRIILKSTIRSNITKQEYMKSDDLRTVSDVSRMKNAGVFLASVLLLCIGLFIVPAVSAEEIQSRAAVVMDAVTGRVLFAKNPDLRLMPASTTKLMAALVVLDRRM